MTLKIKRPEGPPARSQGLEGHQTSRRWYFGWMGVGGVVLVLEAIVLNIFTIYHIETAGFMAKWWKNDIRLPHNRLEQWRSCQWWTWSPRCQHWSFHCRSYQIVRLTWWLKCLCQLAPRRSQKSIAISMNWVLRFTTLKCSLAWAVVIYYWTCLAIKYSYRDSGALHCYHFWMGYKNDQWKFVQWALHVPQ